MLVLQNFYRYKTLREREGVTKLRERERVTKLRERALQNSLQKSLQKWL
jgi:hypothetical protein